MRVVFLLPLFLATAQALRVEPITEWWKPLIGVPRTHAPTTAPVFHRVENGGNTRSVVLAATESNVLAALNPINGSIVWRHVFDHDDPIALFRKYKTVVCSLSGPHGGTLRTFDVLSGELLLERRLHFISPAHTPPDRAPGSAIEFAPDSADALVLTDGRRVSRVHHSTGETTWVWDSEDMGSLVTYSKILATPSKIYVLGLASSFASYTLHLTTISPEGTLISSVPIPSSITHPNGFLALGGSVVWIEGGTIMRFGLTEGKKAVKTSYKLYDSLVDLGLSAEGIFVGRKSDGTAKLFRVDEGGIKETWDFGNSATSETHTEAIFSSGFDKDGHPYVARVYWSHVLQAASIDVLAPHLSDNRGLMHGFTFPFSTSEHGVITHIALDAASPSPYNVVARFVLTTSTGAVQGWQQSEEQWIREEGLAGVGGAAFVELPEHKLSGGAVDGAVGWWGRARRQVREAKDLPHYLLTFFKRFATGTYTVPLSSSHSSSLSRDPFGFRQILILASAYGKVYAVDSGNGEILWSRVLGFGGRKEVKWAVHKVVVSRAVGDEDGEGEGPQVVVIMERKTGDGQTDTVLFHLSALTGSDSIQDELLQGQELPSGTAFFLDTDPKVVLLVDENLNIHQYPSARALPQLHFALLRDGRLVGYRIAEEGGKAYETWKLTLPPGEEIQAVVPPANPGGPIASVGRVLGNRTTLYKYLNPHLVVVLTQPITRTEKPGKCGLHVVDNVKGTIVYSVVLPKGEGKCEARPVLSENWLVYHYWDPGSESQGAGETAKGWRMVSVELYEGGVDEKYQSSDISSFSHESRTVIALEQSFVFPHPISTISMTATKFGVTSKDVIVATRNDKIYAISRRLLDPRRPNRKLTGDEQEEGLLQYDPLLPDDPRRVLSRHYRVANAERILTAPALLESTSLIFAYGLDLFFTRTAPSGTFDVLSEDFNKAQLVFTVSGLVLAIIVTKQMVRRKRLRERWYL